MLKVKKLNSKAVLPKRATTGSAGYDLYACIDGEITINPGQTVKICTGIAIAIQQGEAGFIFARSGLAVKNGILPANAVGVVDSDYRGEVIVALKNTSDIAFTVLDGDRIAQLVIMPVHLPEIVECAELDHTSRNAGGFGSTGKK